MNQGKRKHPSIDPIIIMAKFGYSWEKFMDGWIDFLKLCIEHNDLEKIVKTRYGLQAGMSDVPENLKTLQMSVLFVKLQKSLEVTAKKIIKRKTPLPHDNPNNKDYFPQAIGIKRKRDLEFEKFLRDSSF